MTSCKHCQISTGSIIILDTVSLYNHLADDAIEEIHPVEIHTTNNRVSNDDKVTD